jgi:YHS domain-containing protein
MSAQFAAMMRQIGKQILTIAAWLMLGALGHADPLVTTIVSDPLTGIAIDGYDPVSYFTDPQPAAGKPDYEYLWQGVSWYFESAGNRDVFVRNPTIYAPQYGGHCLTSLSRGYLSDGKPQLYVIDGLKLYFFYSTANRDAFMLSRTAALATAAQNWPRLVQDLQGPSAAAPISPSAGADASASQGDAVTADGAASPGAGDATASAPPAEVAAASEPASVEVPSAAASVAPADAGSNVQAK